MLEARDISISYGKHRALDGVSITVGKSECVVILGANGAGKSSLLRGLTALTPRAPGGAVLYDGRDISRAKPHELVEFGIAHVPEGRGVFTELSVEDNLWLGANPARARTGAAARGDEVYALFPRLAERRKQLVGSMSGGEQQMVAIGRALMSKPDLLLLDEPSLGLAPIVVGEMFDALTRIRDSGMSILMVEQNANMALSIADHGYVLRQGHVSVAGTAAELRDNDEVRRAYLGG